MHFDPTLAVEDPDGDIVRCRWAVGEAECSGVCNAFPNATLDQVSCGKNISSSILDRACAAIASLCLLCANDHVVFVKYRTLVPSLTMRLGQWACMLLPFK